MKITRLFPRKDLPSRDAPHSSWRDSPLVVGVVSGAACITFMGTVVLPLVTSYLNAQLDNKNALIESQKSNLKNLEEKLATAEQEISQGKTEVAKKEEEKVALRKEIRRIQLANPFAPPSIYPRGLDRIHVGDPIDEVDKAYPGQKIDKTIDDYWSVQLEHAVFGNVTYYFDPKSRRISHMLFLPNHEVPDTERAVGELYSLAAAAFGRARVSYQDKHVWVIRNDEYPVVEGAKYLVYAADVFPMWLTRGIETGAIVVPTQGPQTCTAAPRSKPS